MTETTEMNPDKRRGRENVERFVTDVYERIRKDHGYRARFRRALSPALAPQIWGDLTAYVDIARSTDRSLFTLIGASIALEDAGSPGTFGLGAALRACGPDKAFNSESKSDPRVARLRRILRCRSGKDLGEVLRPVLGLIRSRRPGMLDYARLLDELLSFDVAQERVKARWVDDFYRRIAEEEEK